MAYGDGFNNVMTGITGFTSSLFGNNGAADELGVLFNKNGVPVATNYDQGTQKEKDNGTNNTLFIVLGIGLVVALFFMFKK